MNDLIAADSEEKRGRIKELLDLLELPVRLQAEMSRLEQQITADGRPA